jgi:hypothetical protein
MNSGLMPTARRGRAASRAPSQPVFRLGGNLRLGSGVFRFLALLERGAPLRGAENEPRFRNMSKTNGESQTESRSQVNAQAQNQGKPEPNSQAVRWTPLAPGRQGAGVEAEQNGVRGAVGVGNAGRGRKSEVGMRNEEQRGARNSECGAVSKPSDEIDLDVDA